MIAAFGQVATAWAAWIVPASLQVACLGLLALVLDRIAGRRAWHELCAAAWVAVLLRIAIPPGVAAWAAPAAGLGGGPAGSHPDALILAACGTWIAGVLAGCAALLMHAVGAARWCRRATRPVANPELLAVLAESATRVGLSRTPELRVSSGFVTPASVGLVRPAIVIPPGLLRPAARSDLRHVLLHECAHVRRRDAVLALGVMALHVVFWFHPVAWLASRRLAALREIACDAAVTRLLGEGAPAYGRTLGRLATAGLVGPPVSALGFLGGRSQIVLRLEQVLRPVPRATAGRRAAAFFLLLAVLACGPAFDPPLPPPAEEPVEAPGCLRLRFEVMRALADAERAEDR